MFLDPAHAAASQEPVLRKDTGSNGWPREDREGVTLRLA